MLTYSFSEIGSDSLYEYLYKCIKMDILNGTLAAGDKLPSKRSFAKHLNISTITIENAYAQLQAEGYIYSIPKKGYFTADISTLSIPSGKKFTASDFQHPGTASSPALSRNIPKDSTDSAMLLPKSPAAIFADLQNNQTNPANFPFSVWVKLMREVINSKSTELMTNSPSGGVNELRTAIADHLKQFRGMIVEPQQIIVGAGTEYLYGLLIQLLGHDKIYAVEDPGYQKVAKIYQSNQVSCQFIPMDPQGIRIDALENLNAQVAHISPSHHYPTGIITPISRRYELLAWAAKSESRYIVEDDYDSEFRLMGRPIPSLQSIDVMEKVIYFNTFSKSLSPTIRIGYMVLPQHLVDDFNKRLGFYSCTVSTFEQYTLARFIREGYFEKHINRMRSFYHTQKDVLLKCIKNSPLASLVKITEEDSGLHFLMELNTNLSDGDISKVAAREGIRVVCLSEFYHTKENLMSGMSDHILVINYSGLDPDVIEEAIERLARSLI